DLRLLGRRLLDVERMYLRYRRQLVGDVRRQLDARHRRSDETLCENALAHVGHDEVEPQLCGIGIWRILDEADGVWRRDRSVLRDYDGDLIAETVDVFGLEPVVLVRDPHWNLALHELGIGRGSHDPQDITRLVQSAEIVDAWLHILDAASIGIGRGEGHDLA